MAEFFMILLKFGSSGFAVWLLAWGWELLVDYAAGCYIKRVREIRSVKR